MTNDELDTRSAYAMEWRFKVEAVPGTNGGTVEYWDGDKLRRGPYDWSPTTDANACRELLAEVERRKCGGALNDRFHDLWRNSGDEQSDWFGIWCWTAPLPVIVQAACEVLEANNAPS